MPITLTHLTARDIRFPTSRDLSGSDAMNVDPDYSAAYVVLRTNDADRPGGVRPHVHDRPRE
jgi:L-fuconate dehydratase